MKNSPGTSLFQSELFQNGYVDTVAPEELDAEQDKIRLQKELHEELQRVFDGDDFNETGANSYSASVSDNGMEKTISTLNCKLNSLKKENTSLEKTVNKLNCQLSSLKEENASLVKSVSNLDHQLSFLKDENTSLEKTVSNLDCKLSSLKEENSSLERSIGTLNCKLSSLKEENSSLERTISKLNCKLSTLEEENTSLEKTVGNLNCKLSILKEENTSLEKTVDNLNCKVSSLTEENTSLRMKSNSKQEQEMLKLALMGHMTKADMLHREKLSEVQLEYSKKILELEAQLKEVENNTKDGVLKVFTEEIDRIRTNFVSHFELLNDTIEKLKNELEVKIRQTDQANETMERLRSEMEKVHQKYVSSRRAAVTLKEQLDNRTQLLHQRHQKYVETMKEIEKYLDDELRSTNTDKLSQLIEKSLKNIGLSSL